MPSFGTASSFGDYTMLVGGDFEVVDGGSVHRKGDPNCTAGFCGGWDYPKPCTCGGLTHCELVDESWDGCITKTKCDNCGEEEL